MERDSNTIYCEIADLCMKQISGGQDRAEEIATLLKEYQEAKRVELQLAIETLPFSLDCRFCDIDGPETYEKAVAEGWEGIAPDGGASWNFLGECPECKLT